MRLVVWLPSDHARRWKEQTKRTKRMKQQNRSLLAEASTKSSETLRLEETLPMLDWILELQPDIEAVMSGPRLEDHEPLHGAGDHAAPRPVG